MGKQFVKRQDAKRGKFRYETERIQAGTKTGVRNPTTVVRNQHGERDVVQAIKKKRTQEDSCDRGIVQHANFMSLM